MSQNTTVPARSYNSGVSSAVDMNHALPNMVISSAELNAYFPHHLKWPVIFFRLIRAGWTYRAISKSQLWARDELTKSEWNRRFDAIRQQVITAGKAFFNDSSFKGPTNATYQGHAQLQPIVASSYTRATGYLQGVLEHYDVSDAWPPQHITMSATPATLQQLGGAVVNHPAGEQRSLITQAIMWAEAQGWTKTNGAAYTIDDIPSIVTQQGFTIPAAARTDQWDQEGFADALEIDDPDS